MFNQSQEGNNRSVMPLDVLGRTRATMINPECFFPYCEGRGQSEILIVMGIVDCNFSTSTRNS